MSRPADYLNGRPTVNVTELAEVGFAYVRDAARRIAGGDERGASWVFHRCMDGEAIQAFDAFLLQTQHPSIHKPGTVEGRFAAFAAEYAEAVLVKGSSS